MEKVNIFEKILEGMKTNFQAKRKDHYEDLRKEAISYEGIEPKGLTKIFTEKYGQFYYANSSSRAREVREMMERKNQGCYPWKDTMHIREDIDEYIQKQIDEDTDNMFKAFIKKQTEKTEGIIKGRNAEVSGKVDDENLECELHFKLEDGSSFDMRCQVVWKYSANYNLFWQFPTTFHNAINAKGEKIKRPSQKRLAEQL